MPSETDIHIIPLTTNHLAAVVKIERAVFRDAWTEGAFVETLSLSDKCWAAMCGEDVAGYLITQWVLDEVHILNVAVARDWQRRNVASHLLDFLLNVSRRRGMRDLYLEVRVSNVPAIALYEKFGFKELAIRSAYYGDGEDARVMHLRLNEAAQPEPTGCGRGPSGELEG